jgi:hypothetical protein
MRSSYNLKKICIQTSYLMSSYQKQSILFCSVRRNSIEGENRLRVFENRVVRKIFAPKRDEVTRQRRRLHDEELYNVYSSSNITRVIKSRRMRWLGHVARMGRIQVHTGFW